MKNNSKQRVINEEQMLITTKDGTKGLTLEQKIKILINLNCVHYQNNQEKAEKLYELPGGQEAMIYFKNLKVQ